MTYLGNGRRFFEAVFCIRTNSFFLQRCKNIVFDEKYLRAFSHLPDCSFMKCFIEASSILTQEIGSVNWKFGNTNRSTLSCDIQQSPEFWLVDREHPLCMLQPLLATVKCPYVVVLSQADIRLPLPINGRSLKAK